MAKIDNKEKADSVVEKKVEKVLPTPSSVAEFVHEQLIGLGLAAGARAEPCTCIAAGVSSSSSSSSSEKTDDTIAKLSTWQTTSCWQCWQCPPAAAVMMSCSG